MPSFSRPPVMDVSSLLVAYDGPDILQQGHHVVSRPPGIQLPQSDVLCLARFRCSGVMASRGDMYRGEVIEETGPHLRGMDLRWATI